MYFDDDFIKSLPDDPYSAIGKICKKYQTLYSSFSDQKNLYPLIVEFYGLIDAYAEAFALEISMPEFEGDFSDDTKNAENFVEYLSSKVSREMGQNTFERFRDIFSVKLSKVFHYEFSEGDLEKIQGLLNELRTLISKSKDLGEDHKSRLLRRLEKLQSELHKKVSDLDRFWGFFIDASIVVGQMGENAKPMIDLIQKIVRIIWPTQTRAYELPSDLPFKLLGQSQEDDKSE